MIANTLPDGYAHRPPTLADAPAVAALIAACERADTGETEMTAEELVDDWQGIDLAEEAVVVVAPDGRIAGCADVLNRSFVSVSIYGSVHPRERGRGVGRFLVEWGEAWARDRIERAAPGARVVVQHYILASNETARRLLEGAGYRPVRGIYRMGIALDGVPPAPDWPEGISVRTLLLGEDEEAAHQAHEEAFREVWGRPRSTFERFVGITRQEGFDPTLWFLAEDAEEIAAVCLCKMVAGRGWVDVVRGRRPWRGRGLALALLRHAFGEYHRRGVREIGLSVDAGSVTSAPRLYTRAGMHVTRTFLLHQKELRAGVDLGMRVDGA